MLSRTASHLYWMARYVERAENTARMLDVAGHNALLPTARTNEERDWAAPLLITGRHDAYKAEGRGINAADVTAYMALDPENPASIHACLYAARENARAVRSTITSEMWEVVNTTWLGLREFDSKVLKFRGNSAFLAWVKERSHLFRGVTFGTMLHDEAFRFNRLGTYVERADNLVRILDVDFNGLVQRTADEATGDYYQWTALLRSVSALEAYRKVYRHQILPDRIAQLLLLDRHLPRSLMYCVAEVYQALQSVLGSADAAPLRSVMGLYARLDNAVMDDLMTADRTLQLQPLLARVSDVAAQIDATVFAPRLAGTPAPAGLLRGAA